MSIYTKFAEKYAHDISEYLAFIETHSLRERIKYQSANHHILPKWAFPEYSDFRDFSWNKAILYHYDHLKAHKILQKCWPCLENLASVRMCYSRKDLEDEEFQQYYLDFYEDLGKRNAEHNRSRIEAGTHNFQSLEHRKVVSNLAKERYEEGNHPFHPNFVMERFGVDNIMRHLPSKEKCQSNKKETLKKRYGDEVDHNWKIPGAYEETRIKAKKTMLEKYGVEHYLQTESARKLTSERLKTKNPMHNPESVEKKRITNLERYGAENAMQNPEIAKRSTETRLKRYGHKEYKMYSNIHTLKGKKVEVGSEEEFRLKNDGNYVEGIVNTSKFEKMIQTRKKNLEGKEKEIWYKNIETRSTARVRKNSEKEKFLIENGFVKGRGIKGYSTFNEFPE